MKCKKPHKMKFITFIISVILTISLTACGGKGSEKETNLNSDEISKTISTASQSVSQKNVSEDNILKDILADDPIYSLYPFDNCSIEITNRKTSTENKTDIIYASITARAEFIIYSADYILTYYLYDNGWIMDDWAKTDESHYADPTSIDISAVDEYVAQQGVSTYEFYRWISTPENGDNVVRLEYDVSIESQYATEIGSFSIYFLHDFYDGWQIIDKNVESFGFTWDKVIGEWRENEFGVAYVYIHEIDTSRKQITLEYEYDFRTNNSGSSNGIITVDYFNHDGIGGVISSKITNNVLLIVAANAHSGIGCKAGVNFEIVGYGNQSLEYIGKQ